MSPLLPPPQFPTLDAQGLYMTVAVKEIPFTFYEWLPRRSFLTFWSDNNYQILEFHGGRLYYFAKSWTITTLANSRDGIVIRL